MNRPQNTWKILVSDKFGWRESNLIFILEESGKAEKIAMHLTYLIILFKYIINIYNVWQIIQIFVIKQLQKEIRKPTQRHLPSSHCLLRLSGKALSILNVKTSPWTILSFPGAASESI